MGTYHLGEVSLHERGHSMGTGSEWLPRGGWLSQDGCLRGVGAGLEAQLADSQRGSNHSRQPSLSRQQSVPGQQSPGVPFSMGDVGGVGSPAANAQTQPADPGDQMVSVKVRALPLRMPHSLQHMRRPKQTDCKAVRHRQKSKVNRQRVRDGLVGSYPSRELSVNQCCSSTNAGN